ncbi:DUF6314 family protein [Acidothermaceae bacterium B102]|nr:DUF6314 family protein [Acidothermaceae bacterium B102]
MTPDGLVGEWRLQRRVVDRRLSSYGRVAGTLVIEPDGAGLVWREQGSWTMAGRSRPFTRTYLLADGWMLFDDGRPFHPWTPGEWVVHPCGEDSYRGLVDVEPARIRTLWDVTGPAKDQRLVTRLTRVWQST